MNAQPDSLSRPVPSRRRFKTLMEEARRKRRGSVGTALTASTPTLSPSQAGVRMSSTGQTPSTSPFHAFIRPYVWIFSVLAILSVVGTLLELARPLASKYIINNLGAFCWSASNQAGEVMPPPDEDLWAYLLDGGVWAYVLSFAQYSSSMAFCTFSESWSMSSRVRPAVEIGSPTRISKGRHLM